jgi:RNA polymerase sigma-70 factor (ECF subfamily)
VIAACRRGQLPFRIRHNVSWPDSKAVPVRLGAGDTDELSIEVLAARHYDFVWRVLRGFGLSRADAEDATQQVFMIATRKISTLSAESARPFLYGTAFRVAANARRALRRRRETSDEGLVRVEPAERGPEQMSQVARAQALLAELLQRLPPKLRRVLVLAEIEQAEVAQIASLERIPVGTAASRLRRARAEFRELLAGAQARNPFAEGS